ncbi:MAG: hypothetical protein HYX86_03385 [Chloroflexi bacterium]|nr:hypothetical protein [Chloroflexota bacterium]
MVTLLLFIDRLAPYIYALSLLGILAALYVFLTAQREVARARKWIPREEASARAYKAGFFALGLLLVVAGVALIDTRLAPALAQFSQETIPDLTQPSSGTSLNPTPTPTLPRTIIIINTTTPTPEIISTPIPPPPATCPNPGVQVTSPGVGASLAGVVEVRGTAAIENFWYYKLEFGIGEGPGDWSWITAGYEPVVDGFLGNWDTSTLPPGAYTLRLVVVDNTGNFPQPCPVTVNIGS